MASPDDPVYPVTEFTRNMVTPGISKRELFFLHFFSAQIAYRGAVALDASDITKVRQLVDMSITPMGEA